MNYEIIFSKPAAKQFKSLPLPNQEQLKIKIDALATNPRPSGVVKLSGEANLYRIRVGDYRVIYNIEDKELVVLIIKIGNRRDVYR
jgi:mRNA interferase RelE/StbE